MQEEREKVFSRKLPVLKTVFILQGEAKVFRRRERGRFSIMYSFVNVILTSF